MAIGRFRLLDSWEVLSSTAFTSFALNAANNSAGSVFAFEGGHGAITKVMFNATSITSPPTYTVDLQGVASRATPNGTVYGGGTATGTVIPVVGINTVILATPYSGTAGDQVQTVINSASAAVGATASIVTRITNAGGSVGLPYAAQQSAGAWAVVSAGMPSICPIYADEYVGTGFVCPASLANSTPTSSSNPYFVGNTFTPPVDCVCNGVYLSARVASGSNFVLSVYAGSTPTLVGSAPTFVIDKMASSVGGVFAHVVPLSSSLSMTAGTQYRFVLNMTSATGFTTQVVPTFSTQAIREAYSGLLFATTSPSTVSFTDNQLAVYPIIPKIESFTASSGGGVMFQRGMTGGFSA